MNTIKDEFAFTLLEWARGPGLDISALIFVLGIALRLGEIAYIRRKPNLAPARGHALSQGLKTMFTRSIPASGMVKRAPALHIGSFTIWSP